MSRKLFIITGEPSGDLHGSNLIRALLQEDASLTIQAWGGDRMKESGAIIKKHIDELAFMGFIEVARNLPEILQNFKLCKQQIQDFQPDAVLLMDYPGFNLRMAKHIYALGIPVHYYISPQIWAWKESRVKQIKAYVDKVFVILPFEKDFFAKHTVKAEFVGHPLLDELSHQQLNGPQFLENHGLDPRKKIIAFLPGSRTQEISKMLPLANHLAKTFSAYQVIVSKVEWQPMSSYTNALDSNIKIVEGQTYQLINASEACVVTSGTATLETALIGTPQIVVYKANWLSVFIARKLVKVKFISLVNLIMDKEVVTELIQDEANAKNLEIEMNQILDGGTRRQGVIDAYKALQGNLGTGGASKIVANRLLKSMNHS